MTDDLQQGFAQPRVVTKKIFFDHEMTVWELVSQVRLVKKGREVEVAVPPDHPALSSEVAVQYLGQILGAMDGVVAACGDAEVRLKLKRAGLTVRSGEDSFSPPATERSSQLAAWSRSHPLLSSFMTRRKRKKIFSKSYSIGAALIAALIIFLFTAILPRADVILIAETREVERRESFTADTRWQAQEKNAHHVRAKKTSSEGRISMSFPIVELSESGTRAQGMVTFENQTGNEVPVGTEAPLLSEEGIVYHVIEALTIPAAFVAEDNSVRFGTVNASVRAKEPGEAGNRTSGKLIISDLSESKQARVFAFVVSPFTEGSNRLGKVVSEAYIEKSLPQALAQLNHILGSEIGEGDGDAWWYVPETSHATTTRTEPDPPLGTETDTMTLHLEGVMTAFLLARDDVYRLFEIHEKDCAGNRCQLSASLKNVDYEKGTAEGALALKRKIAPGINEESLKEEIAGLSVQAARHLLLSKTGIQDVRITVRMSLRRFLPRTAEKITITLE